MTIEERAKQYAKNVFFMSHSKTIEDIAIRAYSKGATEQKQIDIQKAVEWLKENTITNVHDGEPSCGTYYYTQDEFLTYFRNAMEE